MSIKCVVSLPVLGIILPMKESLAPQLFELLDYTYIGARYHDDYKITPRELKYLARCVELLKEQVETSCETKMKSFI